MKVFYTERAVGSRALVEELLRERYHIVPRFARGEHGKPFLVDVPLFFSLSHTAGRTFVAFSREEVGLDAERSDRAPSPAMLRRLSEKERTQPFARLWTAKEAYVKLCGGTIADMLPSLRVEEGVLLGHGSPLPVHLAWADMVGCTVAVCARSPFTLSWERV